MNQISPLDVLTVPEESGGYASADLHHFAHLLDAREVVRYGQARLVRYEWEDSEEAAEAAEGMVLSLAAAGLRPADAVETLAYGLCHPEALGDRAIYGVGMWAYQGVDWVDLAFVVIYLRDGEKCAAIDEVDDEGIERERWILAFPL